MKQAIALVCALLAISVTPVAAAQCALEEVTFRGVVADANGAPVAGAVLDTRWTEPSGGDLSIRRTSAADGAFDVKLAYDTFSGKSFGGKQKCEFKLERIEVAATRPGFRPETRRLAMTELAEPVRIELRPAR